LRVPGLPAVTETPVIGVEYVIAGQELRSLYLGDGGLAAADAGPSTAPATGPVDAMIS
jgi:hypothetical protein